MTGNPRRVFFLNALLKFSRLKEIIGHSSRYFHCNESVHRKYWASQSLTPIAHSPSRPLSSPPLFLLILSPISISPALRFNPLTKFALPPYLPDLSLAFCSASRSTRSRSSMATSRLERTASRSLASACIAANLADLSTISSLIFCLGCGSGEDVLRRCGGR